MLDDDAKTKFCHDIPKDTGGKISQEKTSRAHLSLNLSRKGELRDHIEDDVHESCM